MVRTAVKTLTLNVFAIPLPAVHAFVAARPSAAYFAELATYVAEQCQVGGWWGWGGVGIRGVGRWVGTGGASWLLPLLHRCWPGA